MAAKTAVLPANSFPIRSRVLTGWLLIAVFVCGLAVWSRVVPLASAIIASGEVIVQSSHKISQHLEGGIVAKVYVQDGMRVATGDRLIELDRTDAQSRLGVIRNRIDSLLATSARLRAERDEQDAVRYPADLLARTEDPQISEYIASQNELFNARRKSLVGQVDLLAKRIEVSNEEITGLKAQQNAKTRQLDLLEQEHTGLSYLYEKGYAPRTRLLALERSAAQLDGERGSHIADIAKAEKEIGESRLRILQLRKEYFFQVVNELSDAEKSLAEAREQERAAADVLNRTTITAPSAGVVVSLAVHTPGEVIPAGGKILEIVPQDDDLIVQVRLNPNDIDRIAIGQKAEIRFTAFNRKTTPTFPAEVTYVSADSLENPEDKHRYFAAKLRLDRNAIAMSEAVRIVPGMPAEAYIKSGSRTLAQYIMKPLTDAFHRAMRED